MVPGARDTSEVTSLQRSNRHLRTRRHHVGALHNAPTVSGPVGARPDALRVQSTRHTEQNHVAAGFQVGAAAGLSLSSVPAAVIELDYLECESRGDSADTRYVAV